MTRMTKSLALSVALFTLSAGDLSTVCMVKAAPPDAETKNTREKQASAGLEKEVQCRIEQLGNDQFAVRERASQELLKLGKAALPGLQKALKHTDSEVRKRAQNLIVQIDPDTALTEAQNGRALRFDCAKATGDYWWKIDLTHNGLHIVEFNNADRNVNIAEDAQGIKMVVTEVKNSKKVKKEYRAKDARELARKHPNAYKIYKEICKKDG